MCESTAYLVRDDGEEKLMDYVVDSCPNADGSLKLTDLLGDEMDVAGTLKEVKLLAHKILIAPQA